MNCGKLIDFYRNFVFWKVHEEHYQARWATSLLYPHSFWNSACSSAHLNRIRRREVQEYLVFLPPVSIHFHSSARVTSSTHIHRSQKVLRRGCVSQTNNDPKQELKHLNKNKRRERGWRGKKNMRWNKSNRSFSAAQQAPSKCQQFQKNCNL